MLKKISKEPLVHFLIAGFLLFIYFNFCSTKEFADNTIVINKTDLLDFMQFQSKAFNAKVFEEKLAQFSASEKQQLLDNYTRDEVLYRTALDLGLDQNDFVIKRRIIQKMEFILDDFDASTVEISEDSLRIYYKKHQDRYFRDAYYTFTHIFFHHDKNGAERAKAFSQSLVNRQLTAAESLPHGDRFLYHRNYSEKTTNFLENQFGQKFTEALTMLDAKEKNWQGPIPSAHGYHLIKLLNKQEAALPEFSAVVTSVQTDYLNDLKKRHKEKQIQRLITQYKIIDHVE